MTVKREVAESPLPQGEVEEIAYKVSFTPWGGSPSSPIVKLYDELNNDNDVSGTKLSGSASISGDVLTTPQVIGLVKNGRYRLSMVVSIDGNKEEAYCILLGEK